jgi:hypothetical protein
MYIIYFHLIDNILLFHSVEINKTIFSTEIFVVLFGVIFQAKNGTLLLSVVAELMNRSHKVDMLSFNNV